MAFFAVIITFYYQYRFYDPHYSQKVKTMPAIVITLANTHETVTRPVVLDVMQHLFKITGIDSQTELSFPDELAKSKQAGSSINTESPAIKFTNKPKISIDIEENYEQEKILSTAIAYPENKIIFADNSLRVFIKPIYSATDMTINIRYRAMDRQAAMRWRDNIRKYVSMAREVQLHHLDYSYLIPKESLVLLKELHRLREAVDGYNQTFEQWFTQCITTKVTTLTNLSGEQTELAIAETQMRVQGYFDFEGAPEKGEKTDDGNTWTISVAYKFKFDKPIGCVVRYPIIVHNQLLDEEFIPTPVDTIDRHIASHGLTESNFFQMYGGAYRLPKKNGYSIPDYDDFSPTGYLPSTMRVFTALTLKDDDYPSHLFSMLELGDLELKPEIIAFMRGEYQYMNKPYHSVFNVSMYCMSVLLQNNDVYVDADLDVHANFNRNKRNYHHVNLSVVSDLSLLTPQAKDRLKQHGHALITILDTIAPKLRDYGCLPNVLPNGTVTTASLNKVIEIITGDRPMVSNGNYGTPSKNEYGDLDDLDRFKIQHNTVATLFVQAERKKQ